VKSDQEQRYGSTMIRIDTNATVHDDWRDNLLKGRKISNNIKSVTEWR